MDNKHYIELKLDDEELGKLSEDVLMTQIRLIAHRLDKNMQFSQSRKKSFTENELKSLKDRLMVYGERYGREKKDYIWAENVMILYEKALKEKELFKYPWKEKTVLNISEKEFEKLMMTRRSIRYLSKTPIADEMIKKIISYGLWAPSTCNIQALKYTVIRRNEIKERIVDGGFTGKEGYCIIAVIADYRFYDDWNIDGLIHDSAAAIQNMLLATHYYGLGACYVSDTGANLEKYRNLIGVEEYEKITALIWLGEYEKEPIAPVRRSIDEVLKII